MWRGRQSRATFLAVRSCGCDMPPWAATVRARSTSPTHRRYAAPIRQLLKARIISNFELFFFLFLRFFPSDPTTGSLSFVPPAAEDWGTGPPVGGDSELSSGRRHDLFTKGPPPPLIVWRNVSRAPRAGVTMAEKQHSSPRGKRRSLLVKSRR